MTDSVTVLVNPAPVMRGPIKRFCYGQNTVLTGSGGTSYFWSPSANLDNPRVANPTAIQLNGSISYYLHVSDANGCNSLKRDTVRVTVTRPAIVFAGRDTVLAINQPLPLHAVDVNNIGFIQYTWSPAYGLNDASIQNPVAIPDKDITYTLTARNSIGCIAVDDIKVKVYKGTQYLRAQRIYPEQRPVERPPAGHTGWYPRLPLLPLIRSLGNMIFR